MASALTRSSCPFVLASEQKSALGHTLPQENRATVMINIERKPLHLQRFLKGCLDFVGAACLILLLLPLFAIVSLLVVLTDGGPILYRRRVVGMGGEFDAFKFRTMRRNADAILAADPKLRAEFERNFKLQKDSRITSVGSLLREISLDELPQLFNVLLGQMSLVGPRMVTVAELEKYGPHKKLLLTVKPGLTGYWQVNGRQNVSYEERVKMDINYIENWNLYLDLKILLRTPFKVLQREGAY